MTKQEKANRLKDLSNPEIAALIEKWVRGEVNREMLKLRFIDEICIESLSERVGLSVQQTKARLYKAEKRNYSVGAGKRTP